MIRTMLVDDQTTFRKGLETILGAQPDIEIVASVSGGRAAVKASIEMKPDLVLMDVSMPEMSGIETTRRLVAALPDVRVLALSMHTEEPFVEGMFDAGAIGYAVKDSEAAELIRAVRTVAGGRTYLSPALDGPADSADAEES